jgi:hypothetical protein
MCAARLSPRSSLNRRFSMAVSPESARVLNPQSQVNVTGIDPYQRRQLRGVQFELTI